MVIGSHNSWSYLRPRRWWQRLIRFAARCQSVGIQSQYNHGVRCFDLRFRYVSSKKGPYFTLAHGVVEYEYCLSQLLEDLDWLNRQSGVYVRVRLEVRNSRQWNHSVTVSWQSLCAYIQAKYTNIRFFDGRDLWKGEVRYDFEKTYACIGGHEMDGRWQKRPTVDGAYSSVRGPRLIDDWWPWLYAYMHNYANLAAGTSRDILLLDFVEIGVSERLSYEDMLKSMENGELKRRDGIATD